MGCQIPATRVSNLCDATVKSVATYSINKGTLSKLISKYIFPIFAHKYPFKETILSQQEWTELERSEHSGLQECFCWPLCSYLITIMPMTKGTFMRGSLLNRAKSDTEKAILNDIFSLNGKKSHLATIEIPALKFPCPGMSASTVIGWSSPEEKCPLL